MDKAVCVYRSNLYNVSVYKLEMGQSDYVIVVVFDIFVYNACDLSINVFRKGIKRMKGSSITDTASMSSHQPKEVSI